MIQAIKKHLKKSGLTRRNKRKDDIIDEQNGSPIEAVNVNENISCFLTESKLTNPKDESNCSVNHSNNNRVNNNQLNNNNRKNRNNSNDVVLGENQSHPNQGRLHCSSSTLLIGKRETVNGHEDGDDDNDGKDNDLDDDLKDKKESQPFILSSGHESQNLNENPNGSFVLSNGDQIINQSTNCCPIVNFNSNGSLVTSALVNQYQNLRQECIQLRRRVRELEQQNQLLTLVLEEQLISNKSDEPTINNNLINTQNNKLKDPNVQHEKQITTRNDSSLASSNQVSILPSSSTGQGQSMATSSSFSSSKSSSTPSGATKVLWSEPEKLSNKIWDSFESDYCRSMKRPHQLFNTNNNNNNNVNNNRNAESYKETRSSQYSVTYPTIQSMSELNSKLGYQSNVIDRKEEKIRSDDIISNRTTITETSTITTETETAATTISPYDDNNKFKLLSFNLNGNTKVISNSNQINLPIVCSKKSPPNINLVHNISSILSSSSPSSSLSSSTLTSFSNHPFTSAPSTLIGSPLSSSASSSSCSSPKKLTLFDRNPDNVDPANQSQFNQRSNQQEKRILFILASNQPATSSISSSLSSFSSASSSSSSSSSSTNSSSFSIEKSSCDKSSFTSFSSSIPSFNKPSNLKLRTLSSSSSNSKSIPSLDKDSPISGETSSDTNGSSKDEGYSTMSSDVQSEANLSGSFISTVTSTGKIIITNTTVNNTKGTENTTNKTSTSLVSINPSSTSIIGSSQSSFEPAPDSTIEKPNLTPSKPGFDLKQSGETNEIRSTTIEVNGSPIAMKLSSVNPIVIGSCRLTTFKDLPEDNCSSSSLTSMKNTSLTSSNSNNINNTKMDVLREEEDSIDKLGATEDNGYNSSLTVTTNYKNISSSSSSSSTSSASWSNARETDTILGDYKKLRLSSQLNQTKENVNIPFNIMNRSKAKNHPHRYSFPPTSRVVTVDGIECTPCVVSDCKPSLRTDFKSIGFPIDNSKALFTDWPKSKLISTADKATSPDFCDHKNDPIYLNHCNVSISNVNSDEKMEGETNGVYGKINRTIDDKSIGFIRTRRLTSFKGENSVKDDTNLDVNIGDKKDDDEGAIVTFKKNNPGLKRKPLVLLMKRFDHKGASSSSSSSSYGSHSLSRSYSDSQLYSDSMDRISSLGRKNVTTSCKPNSRRRIKRETRSNRNRSLRWSTLSTSSSALSDGVEAPIYCEKLRCCLRSKDLLPVKYISSDENHSADDEESHEKFVSRWLRSGTGGLCWDDSEVTWKLNESLDWPESMDVNDDEPDFMVHPKKEDEDTFEEIPLIDDDNCSESDKIEIITSVLPCSSPKADDNSSDQVSSVLDETLVPETNFNGEFYRLCGSVGSKTSLPEVPGLLASTSFPLTDVKEQESVSGNDEDDDNNNNVNNDDNLSSPKITKITANIVDDFVESKDQQKESVVSDQQPTLPLTSELPCLTPSLVNESKQRNECHIESKIIIPNHIPIAPMKTTTSSPSLSSSSSPLNTTPIISSAKSLSPCSPSHSVKSLQSGQSGFIEKVKQQTKSPVINLSAGLKEKKPLRVFKSPIKEPTEKMIINSKENREENAKEQSTFRDHSRPDGNRRIENDAESSLILPSSLIQNKPALIKSYSSNYAKISSGTRIPLPKQSSSLDQIRTSTNIKPRFETIGSGDRSNSKILQTKFVGNNVRKLNKPEPIKSPSHRLINLDSPYSSIGTAPVVNIRKSEERSEKCKEYLKSLEIKRLKGEKNNSRSRKSNDVDPIEIESPTAPSVEEFERRLSEDKQMAEKIKEFYSLFEEKQSNSSKANDSSKPKSTSRPTNNSSNNNGDKPILESIQCKLNYPKAILRRPKGEPSKTTKEGHETSWVHVSGFNVGKAETYNTEKPSSGSSIMLNNHKNLTAKLSSDSCSSEDEANFNINGKKRSSFHQRLLALHRSRRQRKRASGRYMGMGFLPRIRASIVDRLDFYHRFGEKEQEALSLFNFLNEFPISPSSPSSLSSSSASPLFGSYENFDEEQKLLIRCYLNSQFPSTSSSLPASPPSKWPQSPPSLSSSSSSSSSSFKSSPFRNQPPGNIKYINESIDLKSRKPIANDYVDLIRSNSFV